MKKTKSSNILNLTPEEAKAFIRRITGNPRRVLEGQEKKNVWLNRRHFIL